MSGVIDGKVLLALFAQCAADVAPETLETLIGVESSRNPYAIAVVYDPRTPFDKKFRFSLPQTKEEALKVVEKLEKLKTHKSYSLGLMQINSVNFKAYGVAPHELFNVCKNIEIGAEIFKSCYLNARKNNSSKNEQELLRLAASCYYSGNETRGYVKEKNGQSYIDKINAAIPNNYVVPAIKPLESALSNQQPINFSRSKEWDVFGDFRK